MVMYLDKAQHLCTDWFNQQSSKIDWLRRDMRAAYYRDKINYQQNTVTQTNQHFIIYQMNHFFSQYTFN